jgi:hypothetical protein
MQSSPVLKEAPALREASTLEEAFEGGVAVVASVVPAGVRLSPDGPLDLDDDGEDPPVLRPLWFF